MAHPLLHLAAVERIASEPAALPAPLALALREDAEYGRFGALLADLPCYGAPLRGLRLTFSRMAAERSLWSRRLHGPRPVALLLAMAELVARGALVGRSAGRALLSGCLVHLALDRALDPVARELALHLARPGDDRRIVQRRLEWDQALLALGERFCGGPLGDPELVPWMSVVKRRGMPWAGVGGGIYEVLRLALLEVHGDAPTKGEVDAWVRGLYASSRLLASPLARRLGSSRALERQRPALYLGPGIDLPSAFDRGLASARGYLAALDRLLDRGDFGSRARGRFLALVPEGDLGA